MGGLDANAAGWAVWAAATDPSSAVCAWVIATNASSRAGDCGG